jgi:hypothetical protein
LLDRSHDLAPRHIEEIWVDQSKLFLEASPPVFPDELRLATTYREEPNDPRALAIWPDLDVVVHRIREVDMIEGRYFMDTSGQFLHVAANARLVAAYHHLSNPLDEPTNILHRVVWGGADSEEYLEQVPTLRTARSKHMPTHAKR